MWAILYDLLIVILIAVATIVAAFALRAYAAGANPVTAVKALFVPDPSRRLEVVETVSLDGKRRLVLIRRDDVEHVLMIGGPVDVVVETGIRTVPSAPHSPVRPRPTDPPAEQPSA